MSEINNFPIFMAISILINVVPGPSAIYIIGISIAQGRIAGLLSSWGTNTGSFIYTITGALGISALLTAFPYSLTIIKYLGAIYLIVLGINYFLEQKEQLEITQSTESLLTFGQKNQTEMNLSNRWNIFGQGLLVELLNPKVIIFFVTFLPQFINPDSEVKGATFIFLGAIMILICVIWDFFLIMLSTSIVQYLQPDISFGTKFNRLSGAVLIILGIIVGTGVI